MNNPNFKGVEFDSFIHEAGSNAFTLSPQKWISATNALGMLSKSGRYGGTFAHKDIAFEFASWVSAEFNLYIIKDYQRLKADENSSISLEWELLQSNNWRKKVMDKLKMHSPNLTRENLPSLSAYSLF